MEQPAATGSSPQKSQLQPPPIPTAPTGDSAFEKHLLKVNRSSMQEGIANKQILDLGTDVVEEDLGQDQIDALFQT